MLRCRAFARWSWQPIHCLPCSSVCCWPGPHPGRESRPRHRRAPSSRCGTPPSPRSPIAGASERGYHIWESDLKRYLTEDRSGNVEVSLTEEQALKLLFPKSQDIKAEELRLTPEQKARIQERIGWKFPEESFHAFKAETNGKIDGYAVLQETIGKHRPITYLVGVTPDGKVSDVEILVYRESKGSEVRKKRFNSQYEGKTVLDPIRINKDIINITGATMSVRSVSAGVKRALVLIDEFYLKPR